MKKPRGGASEVWRIFLNDVGERGLSMYVCLGRLSYLLHVTLYLKAGKTAQKCFEREAKLKSGEVEKS